MQEFKIFHEKNTKKLKIKKKTAVVHYLVEGQIDDKCNFTVC